MQTDEGNPSENAHTNKYSTGQSLRLNTKLKRSYFLILVAGLILWGATYLAFISQGYPSSIKFSDALFHSYHYTISFTGYKISMLIGLLTIIVGLLASFLYDYTVHPLKSWINGLPRDES